MAKQVEEKSKVKGTKIGHLFIPEVESRKIKKLKRKEAINMVDSLYATGLFSASEHEVFKKRVHRLIVDKK